MKMMKTSFKTLHLKLTYGNLKALKMVRSEISYLNNTVQPSPTWKTYDNKYKDFKQRVENNSLPTAKKKESFSLIKSLDIERNEKGRSSLNFKAPPPLSSSDEWDDLDYASDSELYATRSKSRGAKKAVRPLDTGSRSVERIMEDDVNIQLEKMTLVDVDRTIQDLTNTSHLLVQEQVNSILVILRCIGHRLIQGWNGSSLQNPQYI
jgi:hypothetical protein